MIFPKKMHSGDKSIFNVPTRIIWFSALFMGILASLPRILRLHISSVELIVDASIAFLFSLFVWYYNIYNLPKFSNQHISAHFFNRRLIWSLLLGIALMIILVSGYQLLFPYYEFKSMMLMYEFRGILINLTIYMFLYLLYQSFRAQQMGIELERIKADRLEAQFQLLKQQVNPHFLFNSLNTLKSMIEIGDRHAPDFILKLSDFYRNALENRKMDLIPLSKELEILAAYMFLLRARFEEGINLNNNISVRHCSSYIPPFTLQLLIENCIKHNVVSLEQPLQINLYSADDTIVVENKVHLKKAPDSSIGVGLENINQRYVHVLNKKIEVENGEITFKVKLPVIYEYRHN